MFHVAAIRLLNRLKPNRWLLIEIGALTFLALTIAFEPHLSLDQSQAHNSWITLRSIVGIALAVLTSLALMVEQAAMNRRPVDAHFILAAALLGFLAFMFPLAVAGFSLVAGAVALNGRLFRR